MACSSATTCYATGLADDFLHTVLVPIVKGIAGPAQVTQGVLVGALACLSATTCEAVGFNMETFVAVVVPIIKGIPGAPVELSGPNAFYALSCASSATCVAVGANSSQEGVVAIINEPPADAEACKEGGWKLFRSPAFTSQGDCVSYVKAHRGEYHHLVAAPARPSWADTCRGGGGRDRPVAVDDSAVQASGLLPRDTPLRLDCPRAASANRRRRAVGSRLGVRPRPNRGKTRD